jgi:hypothetical protein
MPEPAPMTSATGSLNIAVIIGIPLSGGRQLLAVDVYRVPRYEWVKRIAFDGTELAK